MDDILRELENVVCYIGDVIDDRDGMKNELDLNDLWQWLESIMVATYNHIHGDD